MYNHRLQLLLMVTALAVSCVLFLQNQSVQRIVYDLQDQIQQSRSEMAAIRQDATGYMSELKKGREELEALRVTMKEEGDVLRKQLEERESIQKKLKEDNEMLQRKLNEQHEALQKQLKEGAESLNKQLKNETQTLRDQLREQLSGDAVALSSDKAPLETRDINAKLEQLSEANDKIANDLKSTQHQIARLVSNDAVKIGILDRRSWWENMPKPTGRIENCPIECHLLPNTTTNVDAVVGFIHQYMKGPRIVTYFPPRWKSYVRNIAIALESNKNYPWQDWVTHTSEVDFVVTYNSTASPRNHLYSSYVDFPLEGFRNAPYPFKDKNQDAVAVVITTNCAPKDRNIFIAGLMKYVKIDSIGNCAHSNKKMSDYPECLKQPTKILQKRCVIQKYKFYIAIENVVDEDYVTEKLFDSLEVGIIAVYWGAPNVEKFLPSATYPSIIKVDHNTDLEVLGKQINEIGADESKYNKYMEWKTHEFSADFVYATENSMYNLACNMCLKVRHMIAVSEKYTPIQNDYNRDSVPELQKRLTAISNLPQKEIRMHTQQVLVRDIMLEGSYVQSDSPLLADSQFPYFVSYPRTGSHWLRSVMELYFNQPLLTRSFFFYNHSDFIFAHSHDEDLSVRRKNVLYLYRDPISTVFSKMSYAGNFNLSEDRITERADFYSKKYAGHLKHWLLTEDFTVKKTIVNNERLSNKPMEEFPKIVNFLSSLQSDATQQHFLTQQNTSYFSPERLQYVMRYITHEEIAKHTAHDKAVVTKYFSSKYGTDKVAFRKKFAGLIWDNVLTEIGGTDNNSPVMSYFRDSGYPLCNASQHASCKPQDYYQPVAIIVPHIRAMKSLDFFIDYMTKYLNNKITYRIFVVEQNNSLDVFNRGKLFNTGFNISRDYYSYFCFHDSDSVPADANVDYSFSDDPVHLSRNMQKFDYELPYENYIGGVLCMKREDFEKMNGFSNRFWGLSFEHDEAYKRMTLAGLKIQRPDFANFTYHKLDTYIPLLKEGDRMYERNVRSLNEVDKNWWWDGISSLTNRFISTRHFEKYSHFVVDV